jgi:tripartite-type tricarboxylate transporter receptor subunit TctC
LPYPSRPVRIIVGFAAGGGSDILARIFAQWLSDRLGQSFVVENRTGAASNVATEAVVRAAPDGCTLLLASSGNAINATLYDNLNFVFERDIAPVSGMLRVPNLVVVHPSVPARSLPEFIAFARANPGKVNMGSGGSGGPVHMTGELFKLMTGLKMQHVPYRGEAAALLDLIGGQVQVVFGSMPASLQYIRGGQLRALAVTTATRSDVLPELPPVADFVPGYEASTWYGIGAPGNTPAEIVQQLNAEINAGLVDPKLKSRLADLGGVPLSGSPANFRNLITEDTAKWAKVIKSANLKPE